MYAVTYRDIHTKDETDMVKKSSYEQIKPSVAVGKNGVTNSIVNEIKNQLKTRRVLKIRLHGEMKLNRFEIGKDLAARTDSKLVDVRGFTVVLTRKKTRL